MDDFHDDRDLSRALAECLNSAVGYRDLAFRDTKASRANLEDLLSGQGARIFGGRYNPRNSFPTVYVSVEEETAHAEVRYYAARFGWRSMLPRVLAGVEVTLHIVLDLRTVPPSLSRLGVAPEHLLAEWEPVQDRGGEADTQKICRFAQRSGFEGILAPSCRRPEGTNLVYFPDSARSDLGSRLTVINPDDLPKRSGP